MLLEERSKPVVVFNHLRHEDAGLGKNGTDAQKERETNCL